MSLLRSVLRCQRRAFSRERQMNRVWVRVFVHGRGPISLFFRILRSGDQDCEDVVVYLVFVCLKIKNLQFPLHFINRRRLLPFKSGRDLITNTLSSSLF